MAKDDQQKQVFCMLSFHENSMNYSDVNHFHIMPPTKDCQYDYYNTSVNGLVTFKTETGIVIYFCQWLGHFQNRNRYCNLEPYHERTYNLAST
ncbi:unnamed protein product [Arabidopsis halleri]